MISDMEQSYKEKYEQAIERLKQWDREHPCAGYVLSDRDKFIFPELAESKQTHVNWSEEEEAVLDALIRRFEGEDIYVSPHLAVECLKSLQDRVPPKQEWSEEDEEILRTILSDGIRGAELDMLQVNWLKSLRPQNKWKPSEGDIIILEKLIKGELEPKVFQATLQGILEQLKKLKEE